MLLFLFFYSIPFFFLKEKGEKKKQQPWQVDRRCGFFKYIVCVLFSRLLSGVRTQRMITAIVRPP
jgi:hypothetical protein